MHTFGKLPAPSAFCSACFLDSYVFISAAFAPQLLLMQLRLPATSEVAPTVATQINVEVG